MSEYARRQFDYMFSQIEELEQQNAALVEALEAVFADKPLLSLEVLRKVGQALALVEGSE